MKSAFSFSQSSSSRFDDMPIIASYSDEICFRWSTFSPNQISIESFYLNLNNGNAFVSSYFGCPSYDEKFQDFFGSSVHVKVLYHYYDVGNIRVQPVINSQYLDYFRWLVLDVFLKAVSHRKEGCRRLQPYLYFPLDSTKDHFANGLVCIDGDGVGKRLLGSNYCHALRQSFLDLGTDAIVLPVNKQGSIVNSGFKSAFYNKESIHYLHCLKAPFEIFLDQMRGEKVVAFAKWNPFNESSLVDFLNGAFMKDE